MFQCWAWSVFSLPMCGPKISSSQDFVSDVQTAGCMRPRRQFAVSPFRTPVGLQKWSTRLLRFPTLFQLTSTPTSGNDR